jgi:hypothetical protein
MLTAIPLTSYDPGITLQMEQVVITITTAGACSQSISQKKENSAQEEQI